MRANRRIPEAVNLIRQDGLVHPGLALVGEPLTASDQFTATNVCAWDDHRPRLGHHMQTPKVPGASGHLLLPASWSLAETRGANTAERPVPLGPAVRATRGWRGVSQHQQGCCASGEHPLSPDREEMVGHATSPHHGRIPITAASLILVSGVMLAAPADAGRVSAAQPTAARSVQADFNHDGTNDLAAGAPFEDVGAVADAGAVSVLPGSPGGLTTSGGRLFTQDSSGVPGAAEPGDWFGDALAAGPSGLASASAAPAAPSPNASRTPTSQ